MMGDRTVMQEALFYSFSLEDHVPQSHLLRVVDRFVDLEGIREKLRPFYSETGRPSIDPELMIRMRLIGYCLGIRSERRLCEEVHLNLAYRWFCRLGLDGSVPDHSTFSKNRHGRFRDSDLLRQLFEMTVSRCIQEGLVGGEGFAVDASLIKADANRQRGVPGAEGLPPDIINHAVREYLEVLDEAAFGAASPVTPKYLSPADPAARWTGAHGDAANLAWLVHERGIEPHIPVFDHASRRTDSFQRTAFRYDHREDLYVCPGGKHLVQHRRDYASPRPGVDKDGFMRYRASQHDCQSCVLKPQCCPGQPARKVMRSIHEGARDLARDMSQTDAYVTSRRERKKVEMLFAHLKRILKLDRLHLRGPNGAKDEFHLAATAQNLRKLAKLIPISRLLPQRDTGNRLRP